MFSQLSVCPGGISGPMPWKMSFPGLGYLWYQVPWGEYSQGSGYVQGWYVQGVGMSSWVELTPLWIHGT